MALLLILAIALVVFTAAVLVLVGLFEAPWPVLLGILVVGLAFIQQLSLKSMDDEPSASGAVSHSAANSSANPTTNPAPGEAVQSSAAADPERWVYRGVVYQHSDPTPAEAAPVTDAADPHSDHDQGGSVSGTYRGQPWQHPVNSPRNAPPPAAPRTYRGVRLPGASPPPPGEFPHESSHESSDEFSS